MSNNEKIKRINQAINETKEMLAKAIKKYNNSIICLKMEIKENKELGNDISANMDWVNYCNEDKIRMNELKLHLNKLNSMLKECL